MSVELSRLGVEIPESFDAELATALDEIGQRWPDGPEPAAGFAAFLAPRMRPGLPLVDLYLAWWCSTGDAAAIAAFESTYERDLQIATARFADLPADELRQRLRIKLFVGSERAEPKINTYSGRGALRGWLRVIAVRTFVDIIRATRIERYEQELDETELLGITDPRELMIDGEVVRAVKSAFAAAVAGLRPRERVFLRHAYVERNTLDEIAALYSVHRATVARTLASARKHLIDHTRSGVIARAGIADEQLDGVIRALDSRVELSLSRVLAPAASGESL